MKRFICLISLLLVVMTWIADAQVKGEGVVKPMNIKGEAWEGYKQFDDEHYLTDPSEQHSEGTYLVSKEIYDMFEDIYSAKELFPGDTNRHGVIRIKIMDDWKNERITLKTADFKLGARKRFIKSRNDYIYMVWIFMLHEKEDYEYAKDDPVKYILMRAAMFSTCESSFRLLEKIDKEYQEYLTETADD